MVAIVHFHGNLGNHAKILKNPNDNTKYIVSFPVAVKRYTNNEERTDWLNCTDFRNINTKISKRLCRGKSVYVNGRLESNTKEKIENGVVSKITYYSVVIENVDLLRNKEDLGVNPNWTAMFGESQTPPSQSPSSQQKMYFVGDANTQLPLSQLGGKVQPNTQVWTAGMPSWLPASQVPELSHLFAPPQAPPPQQPPAQNPSPQGPPPQTPPSQEFSSEVEASDENPF